jgi:hypothetical protein
MEAGLTVNADGKVTPGDQKDPDFRSKAGAGRQTGAARDSPDRPQAVQAVQAGRGEIREAARDHREDRREGR